MNVDVQLGYPCAASRGAREGGARPLPIVSVPGIVHQGVEGILIRRHAFLWELCVDRRTYIIVGGMVVL
jgi:hypothetical protein